MQIIIPMSGVGERFRKAGYTVPKPLIEIEGKPIIAHVIEMFPGKNSFTFICNNKHLETTNMRKILKEYAPASNVIGIDAHKKGPVYAVSKAFEYIEDESPAIVNYCDFSCYWDFANFISFTEKKKMNGYIPAYRGFHPHSLGKTNYAYMKEENGYLREIQEKKPFTTNKMKEFASSGTYHFAKGSYIKHYFKLLMKEELKVGGEYYCSLVYNLMIRDGLNIGIYELEHFMQWGTPEDLEEYIAWSNCFRSLVDGKTNRKEEAFGTLVMPMAGRGSRFKNEGYQVTKPLIKVNGEPMFKKASNSLPDYERYIYICLEDDLEEIMRSTVEEGKSKDIRYIALKEVTDGQAKTSKVGLHSCIESKPITISACDHGVLFNEEEYQKHIYKDDFDVLVWVKKGHVGAYRNPEMYGWVSTKGNRITKVSVKKQINNPREDPIIIGTFTFKNSYILGKCLNSLISRDARVNGELYVDSCIDEAMVLGYRCLTLDVDHYVCWGTPNDLRTFNYWQSCYEKWQSHPYSHGLDKWINIKASGYNQIEG